MNPNEQKQFEPSLADSQSEQRAKKIILGLRKIMQHMDNYSRKLNKCYGLTVPQIICLSELFEKGVMTLSLLSKSVHLSMSTLVGVIDRLEEKGFVQRTRDLKDRRLIFINITHKGIEFVASSPYLLHNRLDDKLQNLSQVEQHNLANCVDVLVSLLND
jgi:DNA-binding MarR family transcriptional regulator